MRPSADCVHRSFILRRVVETVSPLLIPALLLMCLVPSLGISEVTLDGSMGPGGPLAGPGYRITHDLGQQRGGNLFHSFGKFNLSSAESATFSGPDTVSNIIGRITGGTPSSIDGLVRSEIPGANLFLLNPYGIMFGPNARLDVTGSFHASTADALRFSDGGVFFTNPSANSVLTIAPPASFGFLGSNPAGISLKGSYLSVLTGKSISLVGGDIDISERAYVYAPAGRIDIASVASAGEVVPNVPGQTASLDVGSFTQLGGLTMPLGQLHTGSVSGGGTVVIRAGRFLIDSTASYTSLINCSTRGNVDGAPTAVDIAVTNDFTLAAGEIAASSTAGAGKAGGIKIQAGSLEVSANPLTYAYTNIASRPLSSGAGGNIDITTGSLVVKDGAGIYTSAQGKFANAGAGGNVTVNTGTLSVLDGGYIAATTFSVAKGGNLTVTAIGDILLAGTHAPTNWFTGLATQVNYGGTGGVTQVTAGSIRVIDRASIGAPNFGAAGHGGSVVIDAGSVELDNRGTITTVAYGTGPAGNITVKTDSLEVKGASYISSTGFYGAGKGNAGDIDVTAGRVLLAGLESTPRPFDLDATAIFSGARDGQGGNIRLTTDSLTMTNRASLSAASYGSGRAGNITVDAGSADLLSGSAFLSSAYGTGAGGSIDVTANRLVVSGVHPEAVTNITGATSLTTSAIGSQSVMSGGTAGEVRITAGSLELLDGGRLSTETFGPGAAGNIVVQADTVRISGINPDLREFLTTRGVDPAKAASVISSGSNGPSNGDGTAVTGPAGNLQVTARVLEIQDGGRISSETNASGAGGAIHLQAEKVFLSGGATITTKSSGTGNAGSIAIEAAESFESRSGFVTTESVRSGGGGITLKVGSMVYLIDSEITSSVYGGPDTISGDITIDPQFVVLKNSRIVANAIEGSGGNITIVADTFLADPQSVVDASSALGVSGTVDIRAPISNVSGLLAPLSSDVVSASALLRERCIARIREGKYSSFVVGGRDGIPIEPGNLMPSLPF